MTGSLGAIILRAMKKIAICTLKYLSLFVLLLTVGLGYGAWVIASESLSSERLTPLIEMAITRLIPDSKAEIGESTLAWDKEKHTISVNCRNVKYLDQDHVLLATYPQIGLEVSLWSLLSGRILPRRMDSEGATFYLTRTNKGRLVLGGSATQSEAAPKTDDNLAFLEFLEMLGNELADSSLRHEIAIRNATFHINDTRKVKDWTITVPQIALTHTREGATGQAAIEVNQGNRKSTANLAYRFDPVESFHNVTLTFNDINLSGLVGEAPEAQDIAGADFPLTGHLAIAADESMNLMRSSVHLTAGAGTLTNATLWKAPRKIKNATLKLTYENSQGQAILSDTAVVFENGPRLTASGSVSVPVHKRYAWKMPRLTNGYEIKLKLEDLNIDEFDAYWPLVTLPDAREWIVESLHKGVFPSGEITLKGTVDWTNLMESTLDSGHGVLAAKGGSVTYMEGMPPVEEVDATASFDFHAMDVHITAGRTGTIKLQPFTIKMRDLHKDVQTIEIPARLTGPVRDILRLIDNKPLGYAKAVGIDPEDATGSAEGLLTLKMPMVEDLKLDDVHVEAKAALQDVGFKKLIPGIEISQGKLDFNLYSGGFTLKGNVALNNVTGQLDWTSRFSEDPSGKEPLHKALVKTRMKPDGWAAFGLGDVIQTKGETPLLIRYANVKTGLSTLGGEADFTPAAATIESIGLDKPAGTAATLAFDGRLPDGKPYAIESLMLQGKGLRIKGKASLDMKTGTLLSADLNPFIVGRSNANVSFTRNGPGGSEVVRVTGEAFDMSGLDSKKDPAVAPTPKNYNLRVTKLYTSETGYMGSAKIRAVRDAKGWTDIDFWGIAQGTVPAEIKLGPDGTSQVLTIKTDDFGALMKGMGYSDGIAGGKVDVWGRTYPENPRTIKGKIRISNFTVDGVPVFARLLSAVSPFGFMDMITGKAHFDSLRGEFAWQGDDIDFTKVRAAGSVVGINIDGHLNLDTGYAKLGGTVVPFSFVNGIIGSIPLLGDVITGGDGQGVIAAAYTIEGPLSDAKISVNPVSLLTPGFLRNLFFSNEDEPKASPQK